MAGLLVRLARARGEIPSVIGCEHGGSAAVRIRVPNRFKRPDWLDVEATPKGAKYAVVMPQNEQTGAVWQTLTIVTPDGCEVRIHGSDFYYVTVYGRDGKYMGHTETQREEVA